MSWAILAPILLCASALLFITLERWRPYNRPARLLRPEFATDFLWYGLAQSYVLALAIHALVAWVDRYTGASHSGVLANWPLWLQVGFFVVTHDFYIYWFHRAQHRFPTLWRLHEAHHSAKTVDWIAGTKSHPLEILINQTIEFAPMILLGADPDVILVKGVISGVWGMWIHSNIDVRSGALQYVINGPELHRWHHALPYQVCPRDANGCNYGTKLASWDYLFGTAYRPAEKATSYGIDDPSFPRGYWGQVFAAFRRR